jgi:hypothetical protein
LERFADAFYSATPFWKANGLLRNTRFVAHCRSPLYTKC